MRLFYAKLHYIPYHREGSNPSLSAKKPQYIVLKTTKNTIYCGFFMFCKKLIPLIYPLYDIYCARNTTKKHPFRKRTDAFFVGTLLFIGTYIDNK